MTLIIFIIKDYFVSMLIIVPLLTIVISFDKINIYNYLYTMAVSHRVASTWKRNVYCCSFAWYFVSLLLDNVLLIRFVVEVKWSEGLKWPYVLYCWKPFYYSDVTYNSLSNVNQGCARFCSVLFKAYD